MISFLRRLPRQAVLLAVLLLAFAPGAAAPPAVKGGEIRLLEIEGVINPLTARYLGRALAPAETEGVGLVVVRLDTPGGLESSMREMTQAMLASPIPVVVYVAPSGARAASAGMFLTVAAHLAAMAPGTNIGAAHPVSLGAQEEDRVREEKVVNDAAALARALAQARGRNAEWVESAVRESVSITAEEALEQDVIDLVASDLDRLLRELHGRTVETARGPATLRTAGAEVVASPMNLAERILHVITDPNIAYLLFTLGVIGLAAELYNPGMIFPGVVGALSLVLAFVAFGSLPLGWAGLILLLVGVALLAADLYVEGFGALGAAGLAAFVLGSLILYRPIEPISPAMPSLRVSPWLLALMAASVGGVFLIVLRAVLKARRGEVTTGMRGLIGRTAVATSELAPSGTVEVDRESWSAQAVDGPIHRGEQVTVVKVRGVILEVARQAPPAKEGGDAR